MNHNAISKGNVNSLLLQGYDAFPNNDVLPLVLLKQAVETPDDDPAAAFEKLFQKNQWSGSWRNGIYGFHHYHSTAHEVLGCYRGSARVQFGGPEGKVVEFAAGDVLIIPAGLSHKKIESTQDFAVVGAYPNGQQWDMNYGKENERATTDKNISKVPLPSHDPVFGVDGPLMKLWLKE
jgi:uncharacterized protein YjlB